MTNEGRRSGNPARRAEAERLAEQQRSVRREAVEQASRGPLAWLSRWPRWAFLVVVAGLLLLALVLRGIAGGIMLLALAGFLGWLLTISWPVLNPLARTLRVLTVLLVVVTAVVFFTQA